ncbi:hypothetical protein AB0F88_44065 [Streptosporangium sp. NPDC023963]|uniref:hypothetical protein n=1 Tax=Streptosporangium sp. NPDC023963 TaxID=3155608 RepID=UPI00341B04D7
MATATLDDVDPDPISFVAVICAARTAATTSAVGTTGCIHCRCHHTASYTDPLTALISARGWMR